MFRVVLILAVGGMGMLFAGAWQAVLPAEEHSPETLVVEAVTISDVVENSTATEEESHLVAAAVSEVLDSAGGSEPAPAENSAMTDETVKPEVVAQAAGQVDAEATDEAPAEPSRPDEPVNHISEIAPADAEGVIPSLVHKGDIINYLKLLSVSCHKNIIPSPKVRGEVNVTLYDVTWREALDAVLRVNGLVYEEMGPFIYVYSQEEYKDILAARIQVEPRTYRLNYIPTGDVKTLIQPLLSTKGTVTTTPGAASGGGEAEEWAGDNYLVVIDFPDRQEQIAELIANVDRKPPQVMVEATILVASLDDDNQLGIDFNVLSGVNFQASGGAVGAIPAGVVDLQGTETSAFTGFSSNVTGGGLSVGIVKNNLGLFIEALESITDVVSLGNPKILTLNRQTGKVIVGNRDGYVTTEVSQTSTTQTVQFLETGTQLSFRPFVMSDGNIRMELNPKDSDGGVEVQGNFTLPSESTAEVTTNVLVRDGHTIVIGGLFRDRTSLTRSQVPLVGNIPLLGTLFRSTIDQNTREEVIFLITPHIVEDSTDYALGEEVLDKCNRMKLGLREGMLGLARDRLADAHYRTARDHQAKGDLKAALWEVSLATHMSPGFLDAVHLRDELRGRQVYEGEVGSMRTLMRRLVEKDLK